MSTAEALEAQRKLVEELENEFTRARQTLIDLQNDANRAQARKRALEHYKANLSSAPTPPNAPTVQPRTKRQRIDNNLRALVFQSIRGGMAWDGHESIWRILEDPYRE